MYAVIYLKQKFISEISFCRMCAFEVLFEAQMTVREWVFGIDVDLSGGKDEPKVTDPRPISTQH